jgi:predicted nuclease with TOPRIM domain
MWVNEHEERMEALVRAGVTHLSGIRLRLGEIAKALAKVSDQAKIDEAFAKATAIRDRLAKIDQDVS